MMTATAEIETEPIGRRERKKRATRLALKAAALDLVAERGFANVTVEDIADAADVSVRTFFNYFPSKEAAVVGDDPELIEALKEDLIGLPAALDPLAAVRTVLLARLQAIGDDIDRSGEDHDVWLRRLALVRLQPEVLAAYRKHLGVVEQALTDGVVHRLGGDEAQVPYASLVAACALAVMRVAGTYGSDGGADSLTALAGRSFDALAGGLVPTSRRPARPAAGRRTVPAGPRRK